MNRSLKVLVLDDHVEVAEGIGELLELAGHSPTLVHDGKSALEARGRTQFDVALYDVKMPGMNGVECFLETRRTWPDAKVIMMSGYADDGLIARAIENGAIGLLPKPFDCNELLAYMDRIAMAPVSGVAA
jgi:CheY-like chemotaxis protein